MASLGQLTSVAWHVLLSAPSRPLLGQAESRWGAGEEVRLGMGSPISLARRLRLVSGEREPRKGEEGPLSGSPAKSGRQEP